MLSVISLGGELPFDRARKPRSLQAGCQNSCDTSLHMHAIWHEQISLSFDWLVSAITRKVWWAILEVGDTRQRRLDMILSINIVYRYDTT